MKKSLNGFNGFLTLVPKSLAFLCAMIDICNKFGKVNISDSHWRFRLKERYLSLFEFFMEERDGETGGTCAGTDKFKCAGV